MKRYEFTVTLNAMGETPDEAWEDALEGLMMDKGGVSEDEITLIEKLNRDGNEFSPRKFILNKKVTIK